MEVLSIHADAQDEGSEIGGAANVGFWRGASVCGAAVNAISQMFIEMASLTVLATKRMDFS